MGQTKNVEHVERMVPRHPSAVGVPVSPKLEIPIAPSQDALTNLTNTRRHSHGDYRKGAAFTQDVMARVHQTTNWGEMPPSQRESVHMIVHKLQRILEGNPNEPDHWDDIGGYSKLESRILKGEY